MSLQEILPMLGAFLSAFVGLLRWKQLNNSFRVLIVHLFVVSQVELWSYVISLRNENNLWMLHIYTIEEFIAISAFFYFLFQSKVLKKSLLASVLLFVVFSIRNSILVQPLDVYNTYARGLESLLVILMAVVYFLVSMSSNVFRDNEGPTSWVVGAVLLYFSSISLTVFSVDLLKNEYGTWLPNLIWDIHYYVGCLYYLLIGIALWKKK